MSYHHKPWSKPSLYMRCFRLFHRCKCYIHLQQGRSHQLCTPCRLRLCRSSRRLFLYMRCYHLAHKCMYCIRQQRGKSRRLCTPCHLCLYRSSHKPSQYRQRRRLFGRYRCCNHHRLCMWCLRGGIRSLVDMRYFD